MYVSTTPSLSTALGVHRNDDLIEENEQSADEIFIHVPATASVSVQTDVTLAHLNMYSDYDLIEPLSMRRSLTVKDITADTTSSMFYTGLTLNMLTLIFSRMQKKAERLTLWRGSDTRAEEKRCARKGRDQHLTSFQQFLLTLVRLRRGVAVEHLEDMFGVSSSLKEKSPAESSGRGLRFSV